MGSSSWVITGESASRQRESFPKSLWLGRERGGGVNRGRLCIQGAFE